MLSRLVFIEKTKLVFKYKLFFFILNKVGIGIGYNHNYLSYIISFKRSLYEYINYV